MKSLLLAVALLAACGAKKSPGASEGVKCERTIAGLDGKIGEARILWFGEMHGTEESPRFVGDVACQAAAQMRVQVGLEIFKEEQARIDRFLVSKGTKADRDTLLAGPFWRQHDGRSSVAMVALIDRVRLLKSQGARISIVAYDVIDQADRDAAMAHAVLGARDAKAIFVGLSGNIHSRRAKWNELVPLVSHLVDSGANVTTYNVSAKGGTFWGCMGTDDHEPVCGEHPNSDDGGSGAPWSLGPARDDAHDGVYFVGKTTASLPAKP